MQMSSLTGSSIKEFSNGDVFQLIDPETGIACIPSRTTDRRVSPNAPTDQQSVEEAYALAGAVEPAEPSCESPRSAVEMLSWSIVNESWMQEHSRVASSSVLGPPAMEPQSHFTEMRQLDTMSPASGFAAANVNVSPALVHQSCGVNESTLSLPPVGVSTPHVLTEDVISVYREGRGTAVSPSSECVVHIQNSILRAQLLEADRRGAYYMHLHDKASQELENIYKALTLILHGDNGFDENNNFIRRQLRRERYYHNENDMEVGEAQSGWQKWVRSLLGTFGMGFVIPGSPPSIQHLSCERMRPQSSFSFPEELQSSLKWKNDLRCAIRCAFHGQAMEAMENLLLAITSEEFDAWRSLLNDEEWNRLCGSERTQWDCLVAAKLTGFLEKISFTREVPAVVTPVGPVASCPEMEDFEGQEEEGQSSRLQPPLCPEFLVSFLRRISRRLLEGKKMYEMTRQHSQNTEMSAQERSWRVPPHLELEMALDNLLQVSLFVFPGKPALYYLMASLRAMQERREEASELLKVVIRRDPSYLLREGCASQN